MRRSRLLALGLVAVVAAACTSSGAASPSASTAVEPSTAPSEAASVAPSAAPSEAAGPCDASNLATLTAGTLTIGTDNPAYPPYFADERRTSSDTAPWELGDPTNGKGFEGAFAYALADEPRASRRTRSPGPYVPFDSAYRARREDVRHRHQPGLVQRRARPGRRPVRRLLLRQPGRRVAGRQPRRVGDHDQRPGGLPVRRPGRDDELQDHHRHHQADRRGQPLRHERRRHRGAERQADRRASSWTCRPRSTWRRRSSTTARSSASSRPRPAPTPSTSASSWPRTAR